MVDERIIELFFARSEQAISELDDKYGKVFHKTSFNILNDQLDVEECVNDTYLNAWNSMPPHKPSMLATFLGKITRNLSLNRVKHKNAEKRGSGQFPVALEELGDCVSGCDNVEQAIDYKELTECINDFLKKLSKEKNPIMF